ncbi:PREDICTED: 39S ribosomal protein L10, mitochondrial [Dufourea novaeangliae]|uniref:39S ribosomal protein L10, mitochondrial n=1 Tax=Dufourea novaeangliae TaxID=178035 RepID=UPI000767C74B|nr:PREDICTED: 39S ribosomal protein L10, mitochondrial [Dufourea novaeangliae]
MQTVWTKPRKLDCALRLTPNQLLYQQKRFRGKINLKKPKVHYTRAVLNELLTPFFPNPLKDKPIYELCAESMVQKEFPLGPYDKILIKDVRNWFDKSKMIACLHVNSIKCNDMFEVAVPLRRQNMYYKYYGPHIIKAAIAGTCYEGIGPLISKQTGYIFSPDINVLALEKILKKVPQLYTLGGVLDGYVFKYDDFLKYGQMDMVTAQLGLVQALQNAGGVNLNRQLTHHQTTLVTRLKQIGTNESVADKNE